MRNSNGSPGEDAWLLFASCKQIHSPCELAVIWLRRWRLCWFLSFSHSPADPKAPLAFSPLSRTARAAPFLVTPIRRGPVPSTCWKVQGRSPSEPGTGLANGTSPGDHREGQSSPSCAKGKPCLSQGCTIPNSNEPFQDIPVVHAWNKARPI